MRDACEDRRKFCEENGVNFVLYGKQTHAKGPIGSRPHVPSVFPRLSDYVSTMGRTSGTSGGGSHMILTGLKTNSTMKPFFDAIENAKKIIDARKAEEEGRASYVVTDAHAAFHRRIVEDSIDESTHVFHKLRGKGSSDSFSALFRLCPIKIQYNGLSVRFLIDHSCGTTDRALGIYLESILCNAQPPLGNAELGEFISKLITNEVYPQLEAFRRVNDKVCDVLDQFGTLHAGVKVLNKQVPHSVSTRKSNMTTNTLSNPTSSDPVIKISLSNEVILDWDVLTPDSVTENFCRELENSQGLVAAPDALYTIIEASHKQRSFIFLSSTAAKRQPSSKGQPPSDEFDAVTEKELYEINQGVQESKFRDFITILSGTDL